MLNGGKSDYQIIAKSKIHKYSTTFVKKKKKIHKYFVKKEHFTIKELSQLTKTLIFYWLRGSKKEKL